MIPAPLRSHDARDYPISVMLSASGSATVVKDGATTLDRAVRRAHAGLLRRLADDLDAPE